MSTTPQSNFGGGWTGEYHDEDVSSISVSSESSAVASTSASTSSQGNPKKRKNRSWILESGWVQVVPDNGTEKLQCTRCRKAFSYQNGSTSAALRHLQRHGIVKESPRSDNFGNQPTIETAFAFSGQSRPVHSEASYKRVLSRFLRHDKLPYQIVESPAFKEFVQYVQSAPNMSYLPMISADTARSWMNESFKSEMDAIIEELRLQPSICYTTDLWTSQWMDSYMCITAHWINDEWKKKEAVIGFEYINGTHSGENLSEVFVNLLDSYGLLSSLFTITCDNAANMMKMAELIERATSNHPEITFKADMHKVPCIGHIINLAVQTFLEKGLNSEPLQDTDDAFNSTNLQQDPVGRLRRGVIYIRGSSQRRQKFHDVCLNNDLEPLDLIVDVRTRWNSTFEMISRALKLQKAYDDMPDMAGMKLDKVDWLIVDALEKLLRIFDDYTKTLSGSTYPTINQVMPVFQHMMHQFECVHKEVDGNHPLSVSIQAGAMAAYDKLNKYYQPACKSPVYAVATAMDPRAKYEWWKQSGWNKCDIDNASDSVDSAWSSAFFARTSERHQLSGPHVSVYRYESQRRVRTVHLGESHSGQKAIQRTEFLERSRMCTVWQSSAAGTQDLAICASSTPSERTFSQAKLFVPALRNRLSPQALKECVILSSLEIGIGIQTKVHNKNSPIFFFPIKKNLSLLPILSTICVRRIT